MPPAPAGGTRIATGPLVNPDSTHYARMGPEALGEAELLRLVVGSAPAASALLSEFGSAAGLLAASPASLARHVGNARAVRMHAAFALARRAFGESPRRSRVGSAADAARWLSPRFTGLAHEELHGLFLNRRLEVISLRRLSQGSVDHTLFDVRLILGEMLRTGAQAVVLAHNHPSGDPEPSSDDILVTRRVVEGAGLLGLGVVDHLVVAGLDWVSLAERGHIPPAWSPTRSPSV